MGLVEKCFCLLENSKAGNKGPLDIVKNFKACFPTFMDLSPKGSTELSIRRTVLEIAVLTQLRELCWKLRF